MSNINVMCDIGPAASTVHAILEAVREGRPFCQFQRTNYFVPVEGAEPMYQDTTHVCVFTFTREPYHFQVAH